MRGGERRRGEEERRRKGRRKERKWRDRIGEGGGMKREVLVKRESECHRGEGDNGEEGGE